MKNTFKIWTRVVLAIGLAFVLVSCGSPAGVPAPPVEMPSPIVLKFASLDDIHIDVSKISAAPAASVSVPKYVGAGTYSEAIARGPAIIQSIEELMRIPLTLLSLIEVPVGTDITTYTGTFTSPDGTFSGSIKMDFADFDFNGDGVNEGCSGHTAALPICVRMWAEPQFPFALDRRVFAGVVDAYPFFPDATNPGAVRMKFAIVEMSDGEVFNYAINYDKQNSENAYMEMLEVVPPVDIGGATVSILRHAKVTQTGPAATALKRVDATIKMVSDIYMPPLGRDYVEQFYLGQYLEGESDYWAGSIVGDPTQEYDQAFFTDLCAVISTAERAYNQGICADLGISVAGLEFISIAQDTDVTFYDFPEAPTF